MILSGQEKTALYDPYPASVAAVAVVEKTVVLRLTAPVHPCEGFIVSSGLGRPFFTVNFLQAAGQPGIRGLDGWGAKTNPSHSSVWNNRWDDCVDGVREAYFGSVVLVGERPFRTDDEPDPAWFTVTASGGPVTVTEAAFDAADPYLLKLEVSRDFGPDETVTVSYERPTGESGLWDVDGNQVKDIADMAVKAARSAPPAGARAEVVSDAGGDATYALGEAIRVRLTFPEAVEVDTSGGTPRLAIDMDPAGWWGEKWAAYESGSGTTALTFVHTVVEPNISTRGIAVLADTLEANGGTIRLAATGADAALAHGGLGHDPAHKVDWRLAPVVNSPATGAPAIAGTARVGGTLTASASGIADADGLGSAAFAWQWVSVRDGTGSDIAGATSSSYRLMASDEGAAIRVRARFTDDAGHEETLVSEATAPVVLEPLTAAFVGLAEGHDGSRRFGFELRFSEEFEGLKLAAVEAGLQITNGRLIDVKRTVRGENRSVAVRVRPAGVEDMTITLPATTDCSAAAAICASDGRKLSNTVTATVRGPVAVSVADARANEADPAMAFTVSLNRAVAATVEVDYATRDGTATAGEDYTFTRGTLSFAAGETEKTVEVPLLDDVLDEGEETFILKLTAARGAAVDDGEATGTIENSDPLQKMWLSRFGRTVADHVTAAVSDRVANPPSGMQVTVGGQSVDLAETGDGALLTQTLTAVARALGAPSGPAPGGGDDGFGAGPGPGSGSSAWPGTGPGPVSGAGPGGRAASADAGTPGRLPEGRELLLGSAFHLAREGDGAGPGMAAWGRVTTGGFDGEAPADNGTVRIDGSVTSGILGADAEWERLLAGVAVSVSEGEGSFDQPGVDKGSIESTMTTVSPYARFMVNDRLSVWGLAGWGTGDMTIVQDARPAEGAQPERPKRVTRTDLEMRLAALGGRGALLEPDEAGGLDLALRADAFFVETESEAVSNEGGTSGQASRMRLVLEGGRAFMVGGGATLRPSLELGLRHDGGDAETGMGVELGGGVGYTDPVTGLSVEAKARMLLAHADSDYREWGASGAVRLEPDERGRGLSFSLSPTLGATSSASERLWGAQRPGDFAPGGGFEAARGLQGELGYGRPLFGDRFTGTPNVGFGLSDGARDYRIGWRLNSVIPGDPGFEVNLDATRREAANSNEPPEQMGWTPPSP